MLTLLGSALGFLSSLFPDLIKLFKERQDRRHELEVMDRQMDMARAGHLQRLEEINVNADIAETQALHRSEQPTGITWIDGLRGSVRPVITYAFFTLFAVVKVAAVYVLVAVEGVLLAQALPQVWDPETQALFAAVMSFWFGARGMAKFRGH